MEYPKILHREGKEDVRVFNALEEADALAKWDGTPAPEPVPALANPLMSATPIVTSAVGTAQGVGSTSTAVIEPPAVMDTVAKSGSANTTAVVETDATRTAVVIPADWETALSWQERRAIASKLTDKPVKNGDDANEAIRAELQRRAG